MRISSCLCQFTNGLHNSLVIQPLNQIGNETAVFEPERRNFRAPDAERPDRSVGACGLSHAARHRAEVSPQMPLGIRTCVPELWWSVQEQKAKSDIGPSSMFSFSFHVTEEAGKRLSLAGLPHSGDLWIDSFSRGYGYRITRGHCDCSESPIFQGDRDEYGCVVAEVSSLHILTIERKIPWKNVSKDQKNRYILPNANP